MIICCLMYGFVVCWFCLFLFRAYLCSLFVVCGLLFVACCLLFAVCCVRFAAVVVRLFVLVLGLFCLWFAVFCIVCFVFTFVGCLLFVGFVCMCLCL